MMPGMLAHSHSLICRANSRSNSIGKELLCRMLFERTILIKSLREKNYIMIVFPFYRSIEVQIESISRRSKKHVCVYIYIYVFIYLAPSTTMVKKHRKTHLHEDVPRFFPFFAPVFGLLRLVEVKHLANAGAFLGPQKRSHGSSPSYLPFPSLRSWLCTHQLK